jgi:hypothetical protein
VIRISDSLYYAWSQPIELTLGDLYFNYQIPNVTLNSLKAKKEKNVLN